MAELVELVQGLPLPALIVFAAVLALIVGVRHLGLLQGINAGPKKSEATAQVAAVIVDPTALTAAAGEVAGLSVTITEAMAVMRAHTAAVDRHSDKLQDLEGGIEKLRDQLVFVAAKLDRSR